MPWELIGEVLAKGGVVAALFLVALITFGVVFRYLIKENVGLEKRVSQLEGQIAGSQKSTALALDELRAKESEKRAITRKEHEEQLHRISQSHAEELTALHEDRKREILELTKRLDQLQEKRIEDKDKRREEMTKFTTEVMETTNRVARSLDTFTDVLTLLKSAIIGR